MGVLAWIMIGLIAGWLAAKIAQAPRGLIRNLVVGLLGSLLGGFLFSKLGVQVVPDQEEEVYFSDGWYWARHGGRWYRTRDHRGGWVVAEEQVVPQTIVVIPKGKYKHYKQ